MLDLGCGTARTEAAMACLINWTAPLQVSGKEKAPFSDIALKRGAAKVGKSGTHFE